MNILTIVPKPEVKNAFEITDVRENAEVIYADSFGITEDLKEFITFYNSDKDEEELVCMIRSSFIKKIKLIEL